MLLLGGVTLLNKGRSFTLTHSIRFTNCFLQEFLEGTLEFGSKWLLLVGHKDFILNFLTLFNSIFSLV